MFYTSFCQIQSNKNITLISNKTLREYQCMREKSIARCRLKFLTLFEGATPKKRKNRRGKKSKSSHISPPPRGFLPLPPGHLRRQAPSLFRMRAPLAIIIRISIRATSLTCPYLCGALMCT